MDKIKALLAQVDTLLHGEPARAIGYGAAVIIYIVAKASGKFPDVSLDSALVSAGTALAAVVGVVETIRHFVYSPNTVEAIVTNLPGTPPPAA